MIYCSIFNSLNCWEDNFITFSDIDLIIKISDSFFAFSIKIFIWLIKYSIFSSKLFFIEVSKYFFKFNKDILYFDSTIFFISLNLEFVSFSKLISNSDIKSLIYLLGWIFEISKSDKLLSFSTNIFDFSSLTFFWASSSSKENTLLKVSSIEAFVSNRIGYLLINFSCWLNLVIISLEGILFWDCAESIINLLKSLIEL